MKKVVYLAIIVFSFSLISCKSGKGGCGLTSDVKKMEQPLQQDVIVADASEQ